jgi:hypothetical protein
MNLEQIYYFGELIGVVAIVASLLFVGLQMRQNANGLKVNATATAVANWQSVVLELASSDTLAMAWHRMTTASDISDLEPTDVARVTAMLTAAAKNAEFTYFRHLVNEVDDGHWVSARVGFLRGFVSPLTREIIWPRVKADLSPEFGAYIEDLLRSPPPDLAVNLG